MTAEAPFWIVWNPITNTVFTERTACPSDPIIGNAAKFKTRKAATRKAQELARCSTDGTFFYVMKAQSCHQQQLGMADFILVPWGIGAPCPYQGGLG